LARLCEALAAYVEENRPELDTLHRWKIPLVPTFAPFERGSDSLAKANERLKRALSVVWYADPDPQYELAEWYVSKWGGVHNRPEKLQASIASTDDELFGRRTAGIASRSKLVAIRDSERFAIFDAQVSFALNALQIVQEHEPPIFFPNLLSKNRKVGKFHDWVKTRNHGDAYKAFAARAYVIYLRVLAEVAQQLALADAGEIVMLLVAQTEDVALQTMSHPCSSEQSAIAAE